MAPSLPGWVTAATAVSSSPGCWHAAAASGQSAVIIYTPADLSDLQTVNWADIQHRASVHSTLYRRTLLSLTSIRCQIDIAAGRRRLTTSNWRQFDVPVLSGTVKVLDDICQQQTLHVIKLTKASLTLTSWSCKAVCLQLMLTFLYRNWTETSFSASFGL